MARKPNILFVFSDQHRHDVLGCAGHPLVQNAESGSAGGLGHAFRADLVAVSGVYAVPGHDDHGALRA